MSIRVMGNAVIAALEAANITVGDAVAPEGVGWQGVAGQSDFIPYTILYPTGGGMLEGSIGTPRSDFSVIYQMTCVGSTREQTDWMRDTVREIIFTPNVIDIPGFKILEVVLEVPIATSRDDDTQPPLFYSADRYRVTAVPLRGI